MRAKTRARLAVDVKRLMQRRRFWILWAVGNIVWFIVLPWLFGVWLAAEIRTEYETGARVSTDGDSISIPIAGVIMLNFLFLVLLNAAWGIYSLIRRRRDI
jgi:hypothetical protein